MPENQKAPAVDPAKEIIEAKEAQDPKDLSLDSLVLLLNTTRLNQLQVQSQKELSELKKRQEQVSFLHNLMKAINKVTSAEGELDVSGNADLQNLLKQARETGVDLDPSKQKYTKDERDRLMENIRMTVEDYNVQNEMQLQTLNRLANERYESYQMARSILKPLHEAKMTPAKGIKGG